MSISSLVKLNSQFVCITYESKACAILIENINGFRQIKLFFQRIKSFKAVRSKNLTDYFHFETFKL